MFKNAVHSANFVHYNKIFTKISELMINMGLSYLLSECNFKKLDSTMNHARCPSHTCIPVKNMDFFTGEHVCERFKDTY